MPKYCCAIQCSNVYSKGSGIHFYRFPVDEKRRRLWIAAVKRKDWFPTEHTWICSEHFVSKVKSNNLLTPNYVPTIFQYTSPDKQKLEAKSEAFMHRQSAKKRRIEESGRALVDKENIRRRKSEVEIEKQRIVEIEEKRRKKEIEDRRKVEDAERLLREEAEKQKRLEEEAK